MNQYDPAIRCPHCGSIASVKEGPDVQLQEDDGIVVTFYIITMECADEFVVWGSRVVRVGQALCSTDSFDRFCGKSFNVRFKLVDYLP